MNDSIIFFTDLEIQLLKQGSDIKSIRNDLADRLFQEITALREKILDLEQQLSEQRNLGNKAYADALLLTLQQHGLRAPIKGRIVFNAQNTPIGFEPDQLEVLSQTQTQTQTQIQPSQS